MLFFKIVSRQIGFIKYEQQQTTGYTYTYGSSKSKQLSVFAKNLEKEEHFEKGFYRRFQLV